MSVRTIGENTFAVTIANVKACGDYVVVLLFRVLLFMKKG